MGESPDHIMLSCPGCSAQFRLRPKHGKLPEGPIPCPRCDHKIPVNQEDLADDTSDAAEAHTGQMGASEVSAAVRRSREEARGEPWETAKLPGTPPPRSRSGTALGGPRSTYRLDSAVEDGSEDDEFDHIDASHDLRVSNPKSTFLGMGSSLGAIGGPARSAADRTRLVGPGTVEKLKKDAAAEDAPTTPAAEQDEAPAQLARPQKSEITKKSSALKDSAQAQFRETSEQAPATRNDLLSASISQADIEAPEPKKPAAKTPGSADATAEAIPAQKILGRIKLKQKLKQSLKKSAPEFDPKKLAADGARDKQGAERDDADDVDTKPSHPKPTLASLLKKARSRKNALPKPSTSLSPGDSDAQWETVDSKSGLKDLSDARTRSADALDRALSALADETARALAKKTPPKPTKPPLPGGRSERPAPAPAPKPPLPYETGESSMIELLRRRVAENQQPGAASERRGSGYIRLPTAEIQEVLGQGTYRLRVEDIIYEPIDKEGLTELIKRGVLMGAAQIAESDGDWMPISEHPMLAELRQKMAAEAHDLLNTLGKSRGITSSRVGGPPSTPPEPSDEQRVRSPYPTTLSGMSNIKGPMDTFDEEFGDLKDSAEIATLPQLEARSAALKAQNEQGEDFFTANSGLFAEMDAERETTREIAQDQLASVRESAKEEAAQPEQPIAPPLEPPKAEEISDAPEPSPEPIAPPPKVAAPPPEPATEAPAELDQVEAPTAEITTPELAEKKKSRAGLWLLLLLLLAGGIAALAYSPIGQPYVDELMAKYFPDTSQPAASRAATKASPSAPGEASEESSTDELSEELQAAIDSASSALASALQVDPNDPELQASLAGSLAEAGEHAKAARVLGILWPKSKGDPDFVAEFASELIKAGQFGRAVDVAVHGLNLTRAGKRGEREHDFVEIYEEAIDKNPELGAYHTIDLKRGEHADSAQLALRGERPRRVVVELRAEQAPTFQFNPSQKNWERDWRASIAAWRLCEVMVCNFDLPRTRPARVDRATFQSLLGDEDSDVDLSGLNWVRESGEEYLYGALVDTTEGAARFPVESTSLWRSWLVADSSADLDQLTAQALLPLKDSRPELYEPLAAALGDTALGQTAAQLSTILLFDFLTNNWDRFRRDSEDWGAHLGLRDGRLISTVNVTTFQPRSSTRVKGRFGWTSRFSRDTVTSLRLLERETLGPLLFPKASGVEKAAINVFWEQHAQALGRIERLVESRGSDQILAFE